MPRARAKYPSVDAYVATLPDGWASYPTCEVNAAMFRALRERGTFEGLAALPVELSRHFEGGAEREWLPEIVGIGCLLAVRDARFGGASGEVDFLAWMDAINAGLLQSALPSTVTTPAAAVDWMAEGWSQFHRGTSFTVLSRGAHEAVIAFAHPAHIFPGAWMEVRRRTLTSVLARGGAAQPTVRATRRDDGSTLFDATWR